LNNPTVLIAFWQASLFDGENSDLQKMFRRNPAETHQYPNSSMDLEGFLKTSQGQVLLRQSKLPADDYKLATIMLPFIAAFDTFAGHGQHWQADPTRLFSLRSARQFDTVWFDLAYQLGL